MNYFQDNKSGMRLGAIPDQHEQAWVVQLKLVSELRDRVPTSVSELYRAIWQWCMVNIEHFAYDDFVGDHFVFYQHQDIMLFLLRWGNYVDHTRLVEREKVYGSH
jgi:hypothetical protein